MITSKTEGVALVQVLIMTAIMSLIAIQFTKTARHQVEIAKDFNDRIKAELLLKTARSRIVFEFFRNDSSQLSDAVINGVKWNLRGIPFDLSQNVSVSITSTTALLSVITAPKMYLHKLLLTLNVDETTTLEVIDAINDWIDVDDITSIYGAEKNYYQGLSIEPRNGPLQHISELNSIRGITPELYSSLKGLLTIYTSGSINPSLAKPELVNTIFEPYIAQQILQAQKEQNFSEDTWQGIVGSKQYEFVDLHPRSTFMVSISAKYNDVIITSNFDLKVESQKSKDPIVILANY
ncbi:MAG: type II secretion system protein GspK [Thalassotalea sp.]|nr:type II secretion system protein GspK [Thalassotalea sp.]